VVKASDEAVRKVCQQTGEVMNGLVVVDSKEDRRGKPLITEINLRHIATTSSVANAGVNMSEYQLLTALGRSNELSKEIDKRFPPDNMIFRDIDGLPLYVNDFREMKIGESR
jgi:carbamoyl-phosphate synthase large subunit